MTKKATWRVATIIVLVLLALAMYSNYRLLVILGIAMGCIISKGPMKFWIKLVGFAAEILYSMFGKDQGPEEKTTE